MNIFVTGGAGYIGSAAAQALLDAGHGVTGHPIPVKELPRRPGEAPRLVAASSKIQRELGWEPEYPDPKDIVASAWEWHRTHPNGYA
jgi:UDP-glucose 4-epimerase